MRYFRERKHKQCTCENSFNIYSHAQEGIAYLQSVRI